MAPTLDRITVYPVKSLDPDDREAARIDADGSLVGDREYAVVVGGDDADYDFETTSASDGVYVNGKYTDAVHRLRTLLDEEAETLSVRVEGDDETRTFDLDDPEALNAWLSEYYGEPVSLRRETPGGFPDRRSRGPSVVSTATLREVASWFDGVDVDSVRRRFRANLEVGGVPAFWEDRLYGDDGEVVAFEVGGVRIEGVDPCGRCVVPTRDPDTGEATEGFRETFLERRRETLPEWLDSDRFDHPYYLMTNTRVPEASRGETLRVGDDVRVLGRRAESDA